MSRRSLIVLGALAWSGIVGAQELHRFATPAKDNPVAEIEGTLYRPVAGGPYNARGTWPAPLPARRDEVIG